MTPPSDPSLSALAREAIYAKIPEVNCKGLCVANCGPILCSKGEAHEIEKWTGQNIMEWADQPAPLAVRISPCTFLLAGRCSIYSMRPAICRLFGAVDHAMLRCPHGCRPEKYLTERESRAILAEIEALSSPSKPSDTGSVADAG